MRINPRINRRFRPCNLNGCVLYLPFYSLGSNAQKIWDLSGQGNHGTISGPVPGSYPMLDGSVLVTNGTFTGDTGWTKGTGWAITTVATKTAGVASDLEQDISVVAATKYFLKYTITRTGGSLTPQIGGVNGTARSESGTYTDEITATGTGNLKFQADSSFAGTVDNVSVQKITGYESLGWYFDGSNDYVLVVNSSTLDGITACTVLIWTKVAPDNPLGAARLWSMYKPSNANWHLEIAQQYPANGNLAVFTTTLGAWTDTGVVLLDNTWKLVSVTISGTTLKVYVNGVLVQTYTSGINTGTADSSVFIGADGNNQSSLLKMNCGEALFFSRAFSAEEIKSYYELTRSRYGI